MGSDSQNGGEGTGKGFKVLVYVVVPIVVALITGLATLGAADKLDGVVDYVAGLFTDGERGGDDKSDEAKPYVKGAIWQMLKRNNAKHTVLWGAYCAEPPSDRISVATKYPRQIQELLSWRRRELGQYDLDRCLFKSPDGQLERVQIPIPEDRLCWTPDCS
ncbi:MAG: hypothetical protein QNJ94_02120 [Alphaproteobacteria bacterium]|nr:hypothetical protein [Alphaproteobacteria bacterium]